MTLQRMLDNQLNLQEEVRATIGLPPQDTLSVKERCELISDFATHMVVEVGEFLQELPYFKWWKLYEEHDSIKDYPNYHELLVEFTDIFLFFLNMGNLLGLSGADIENLYFGKASDVLARERKRHLEKLNPAKEKHDH